MILELSQLDGYFGIHDFLKFLLSFTIYKITMGTHFMESLINSQQLDDESAESDTECGIDICTEPLHIGIDDSLDAEDSDNLSTSGDEARPRYKIVTKFFLGNLDILPLPQ